MTATPPHRTRRRVGLGIIAAIVIAATVVAWLAATRARTPAQQAAQASPPAPSIVTALVTTGTLDQQLNITTTVHRSNTLAIHGPSTVAGATKILVTRMPLAAGEEVTAGTLLAEVSGRPVIALQGKFGAYRDLTANDTGPDVRELQRGLRQLYGTPVTGRFDWQTEADLRRLYTRVGYTLETTTASAGSPSISSPAASSSSPRTPARQMLLPAGEIAFIPNLPAIVSGAPTGVGGDAAGTLLSVATGTWTVSGPVDASDDAQLSKLRSNTPIKFGSGPLAGQRTRLLSLAPLPQSSGQANPNSPVATAAFAVGSPPHGLSPGDPQEVTITLLTSPPGALIVPASALWTAPDGTVVVEVVTSRASAITHIPVRVAATSNGRDAIIAQGGLHAGDKVAVAYPDSSSGH